MTDGQGPEPDEITTPTPGFSGFSCVGSTGGRSAPSSSGVEIWALLSHRAGESQQVLGLAEALQRERGWHVRVLTPRWTPIANSLGLGRRVSLLGLHHEDRRALGARTPDLLISAGLRNEPIVRWLARRSRRRTVTVMLGRTWAAPAAFDLVVSTPQYRLSPHPNVLENPGTLHRITTQRLMDARIATRREFGAVPGPRLGLLVGGNSGTLVLGKSAGRRLAQRARSLAGEGTVLATTSSRTPEPVSRALEQELAARDRIWRWQQGADNPYFAILAWADALLVTGDSIAMVSEAIATGRPVRIFDPGGLRPGRQVERNRMLRATAYGLLATFGPRRLSRDLARAHAGLVGRGDVQWDDVPLSFPAEREHDGPDAKPSAPAAASDRPDTAPDYVLTTCLRVRSLVARRSI